MFAAVTTAIVMLFTSPASSAPVQVGAKLFGFNDNATVAGDLSAGQDAELLANAGSDSARITIDWSWVEHTRGQFNFGLFDPVYRAWRERGIRPLIVVTGAPAWARA